MPRLLRTYYLIMIASCFFTITQGQETPRQRFFKRITPDMGLSQPMVNGICRDTRGFIWFATEDGLNRYDGNEFRVFRHTPGDTTSLSHNLVEFIQEDSLENLWVGTADGLNYYNRATERFTTYQSPRLPGTIYLDATTDKKRKRLWLAAGVGGLRYLPFGGKTIETFDQQDLAGITIMSIEQSGDSLFLGTLGKGLRILNLQTNAVTSIGDTTSVIRGLHATARIIWFGTGTKGLGRLDRNTLEIQYYSRNNGMLSNNDIWSVAEDAAHNLWIGTDGGGLNILSPGETKARIFRHSEFDERTISANTIRCVYIDAMNHVWLGTYNGGVSYYGISPILFELYKKEFATNNTLQNNSVTALAEGPDNTLWIGTDGGGLHYMKDGIIHPFGWPSQYKEINVITALFADSTGLWIGTFMNGLLHRDPQGRWNQYLNIPGKRESLSDNIVWVITKDAQGYLWIGTDLGVNRFNAGTRTFNNVNNPLPQNTGNLFQNIQVQALCAGKNSTLWVGYYNILTAWKTSTDSIAEIRSNLPGIRNLRVKALLEDGPIVWIGTYGNGLGRYDTRTNTLSIIDEPDGLPNNVVLSIEKENNGNLWLATNKGLVHFNVHDTLFTTFDASYGVQGTIFNRGSSLQLHDGSFVFGGTKGFNIFQAGDFHHDLNNLRVAFTDFLVANRSIKPGTMLLPESITTVKDLDLPYDESRIISFAFSALSFLAPERIVYSYKLAGFDSTWLQLGKTHTITFTNLSPGDYKLYVRASYNGRTWGRATMVHISIQTPWWDTALFRTAMVLGIIGLTYAFYQYRLNRLQARKKELEQLVQEQSREIQEQNKNLASQNEELTQQNEEVMAQKEMISAQNTLLYDTKQELQKINESLEQQVLQRTVTLNDTITQLNKTIKELDAFVYSASHDLVAPLKSVLGLVDLARRENPGDGIMLYLNHIELSIRKLENVILNMIQYSRNTRLEVTHEEIDMQTLLEECVSDVQFMPGASDVKIHTNIDPDHIINSDSSRIKIICGNLISNAIKYRDVRKDACLVNIRFEKGRTSWRLEIADNGIGIDKKYLSRVFEMFFRATDRAQGSGLGLYIVAETVNRLYGEIHADSQLGEWTKFVVNIPNDEGYRRHK